MKRIRIVAVMLLVISLQMTGATVWGAPSTQLGVIGDNEQVLSRVTTLAGTGEYGEFDGEALQASFRSPSSVVVLPDGVVLVTDSMNHKIRKLVDFRVSTYAGITFAEDTRGLPVGGYHDDSVELSVFQEPAGMTADAKGTVYVADSKNHLIRKVTKEGMVSTLAGNLVSGNDDGIGNAASFNNPQDVAVAADGTVYVADTLNHAIRRISPDGRVTTLNAASSRVVEVYPGYVLPAGDYKDGLLAEALFNEPTGLALDASGNLYVSDSGNQRIRYIDFASGYVTTAAGSSAASDKSIYLNSELYAPGGFRDGNAVEALLNYPRGLEVTAEGGLLIADSMNHSIRYLYNGKVTTIAGDANQYSGKQSGFERNARFQKPTDVAVMADGNLLVADSYNNTIQLVRFYQVPSGHRADGTIKVLYDQSLLQFDRQPEIVDGRTMVPLRTISDTLGFQVEWNDTEGVQFVDITKGKTTVRITIGSPTIQRIEEAAGASAPVVTESTDMGVSPYLSGGNTFVPLRFLFEHLGVNVQWLDDYRTVLLRSN